MIMIIKLKTRITNKQLTNKNTFRIYSLLFITF